MKKTLLFSAMAIIGIVSFAQGGKVISDKNAQKRNISGFHAIRISGGIDLYLSQAGSEAVAVSASKSADIDKIKTEVVDGVLKIYLDTDGWHWGGHESRNLKAYVSCKVLDALRATGGSDIYFEDLLHSDKLAVELTGGSDLRGKVDVQVLSVDQTGGSDSYLSGTATHLSVHATGGSDLHAFDLLSTECHIEATGGSDCNVHVDKELSVSATGGSDVSYKGNAVVRDQHTSGSSSVTRKG